MMALTMVGSASGKTSNARTIARPTNRRLSRSATRTPSRISDATEILEPDPLHQRLPPGEASVGEGELHRVHQRIAGDDRHDEKHGREQRPCLSIEPGR